jgi:two-component system, LytTR family, response regulator
MKKIKALIVDDEELARKNLEFLLNDCCPNVEVVELAANAREARKYLEGNKIDLLFLDIEMPNGSGFDLLESLKEVIDFKIIFITACHEYALKAFKFSAVDYLLKPIHQEDLEAAVAKVNPVKDSESREKIDSLLDNISRKGEQLNKIALPSMEDLQFINLDEIIYCESQDNYTQFF